MKFLLAASLGVASFSVLVMNATSASASVASQGLTMKTISAALKAHAGSPGTWGNAIEVPGTAALNTAGNAGVITISCISSGNCTAGGNYLDGSGHLQTFVTTEAGGTWGNAVEVPGTAALNVGGNAIVNSISCPTYGNCAAGGAYTDGSGYVQGFVANETGGTWGNAVEVSDAQEVGSANAGGVETVSCIANESCSAVGFDVTTGGAPTGFVLNETGVTWGAATEITMTSTLGSGGTGLYSVSCSGPGDCGAEGVGVYQDAAVHGGVAFIPFVVDETNGTWGAAAQLPGLSTLNVGLIATVDGISCTFPGDCSTGGNYTDGLSNAQAFVADETNGTWGAAIEVPGSSSLNVNAAIVNSISCSSPGNCGASGFYTTSSLTEDFVVSETNGSWGNAVEVPGSSSLFVDGAAVDPNVISCSSAGNCSSAGAYIDDLGNYQAYVVTEKGGTWGDAIEAPGSGTLNTAGGAEITAISCSQDSACAAGGYYATGTQTFQALVTDMAPLYIPQAALTLGTTHGTAGTALKLTTSGGSGTGAVTYFARNGTAKGCAISGSSLKSTSAGTCVVTAMKSGDSTYLSISTMSTVAMVLPAKPRELTVDFVGTSAVLGGAAKSELNTLAKKLVAGASITVTGYAKGDASLARSRAAAVASYLSGKDKTHATIKTVTSAGANSATVVTTKQ